MDPAVSQILVVNCTCNESCIILFVFYLLFSLISLFFAFLFLVLYVSRVCLFVVFKVFMKLKVYLVFVAVSAPMPIASFNEVASTPLVPTPPHPTKLRAHSMARVTTDDAMGVLLALRL